MPSWIIEPRDPLIVRDGRPFGPTPGARAESLPFPFPSTVAGGVRTRAGVNPQGRFVDTTETVEWVKKIAVRGPLLMELAVNGQVSEWFAPAPADALLFNPDKRADYGLADDTADARAQIWRSYLRPIAIPSEAMGNVPTAVPYLVGPERYDASKPLAEPPRFWRWSQLEPWLLQPQSGPVVPAGLGHRGPQADQRMHVSIEADRLIARDGALFQTRGLEFTGKGGQRLALLAASDTEFRAFSGGLAPLGGERRLVRWQRWPVGIADPLATPCPPDVVQTIQCQKFCRLLLLTPALFTQGWHPDSLMLAGDSGVTITVVGAAVPRPQVVSGWDFQKYNGPGKEKGGPKPSRRLAPAGAVYFLRLSGEPAAIGKWITSVWMQAVSDNPLDRADGFGLAAVGTWDGAIGTMEVPYGPQSS